MAIHYVDLGAGSDASSGASWALAKKNLASVTPAAGDEVRIAKSPDPQPAGVATWTDGSQVVVFDDAPSGLTVGHLLSKNGSAAGGDEPWWLVTGISGVNVTIKCGSSFGGGYVGASERVATYRRSCVSAAPQVVSYAGSEASPVSVTAGWDPATGLHNGETFMQGAGTGTGLTLGEAAPAERWFTLDGRLSVVGYYEGAWLLGRRSNYAIRWCVGNVVHGAKISTMDSATFSVAGCVGNGFRGLWGAGGYGVLNITCGLLYANGWADQISRGGGYYHDHPYSHAGLITGRSQFHIGRVIGNYGSGVNAESYQWVDAWFDVIERNGADYYDDGEVTVDAEPGFYGHGDLANVIHVRRIANNRYANIWAGMGLPSPEGSDSTIYVDEYAGPGVYQITDANTSVILPALHFFESPTSADGSVTLTGRRSPGASVAVSCPTATVGSVSYPDATTFQASATGLQSGANIFTASDGANTAEAAVAGPAATLDPVVNAVSSPTSDEPIIISGRVPSYLEGSVTGTATATADLVLPIVLVGAATATATATADLSTPARLAASVTATAVVLADLTAGQFLELTAEPFVTAIPSPTTDEPIVVSGVVPPWAVLEASATATAIAEADLFVESLVGLATATAIAEADLTAVQTHALAASVVATATASLASGTHTYPVVDVSLSAAERTILLHHGRVDVVMTTAETLVLLTHRRAA